MISNAQPCILWTMLPLGFLLKGLEKNKKRLLSFLHYIPLGFVLLLSCVIIHRDKLLTISF